MLGLKSEELIIPDIPLVSLRPVIKTCKALRVTKQQTSIDLAEILAAQQTSYQRQQIFNIMAP